MMCAPFKEAGEWFVNLSDNGEEETAGPFDEELDAINMARRWGSVEFSGVPWALKLPPQRDELPREHTKRRYLLEAS